MKFHLFVSILILILFYESEVCKALPGPTMEEDNSKGKGHSDDYGDVEHSKGKGHSDDNDDGEHSKGKGDNSKGKGENPKGKGHSDDNDDGEHSKGKGGNSKGKGENPKGKGDNSKGKGENPKGKGDNSKGKGENPKGKGTPSQDFCPCSKGELYHDEQQYCLSCASTDCAPEYTCVMTRTPPNTKSQCICQPACVPVIY